MDAWYLARTMDFILYRHNLLMQDNAYPDEMLWEDAVEALVYEPNRLRDALFEQTAEEVSQIASNAPSWNCFVSRHDWLGGHHLGELRALMEEEKITVTGLVADMIMKRDTKPKEVVATSVFLTRLQDYQTSTNHNDRALWYLTYEGKLGRTLFDGENSWALQHLRDGKLEWDRSMKMYVATEKIDGQGCTTFKKHRRITAAIGQEWNENWRSRAEKFLDGGEDCKMIIDRDFKKAYTPTYRGDSVLDGDFVTGMSCMSGKGDRAQEFYGKIDNCYVCRFENAYGEQVGRCLMYEYEGVRHFIRIYALTEYQNAALRILNEQMNPQDIKGRSKYIEGMKLRTHWTKNTRCMYLDGSYYGGKVIDGKIYVVAGDMDCNLSTTGGEAVYDYMRISKCEHCRKIFSRGRGISVDGHRFCCEECARRKGYEKCGSCGDWHKKKDMLKTSDGHLYCGDYCAQREGYYYCDCCNKWQPVIEGSVRTIEGRFYCSSKCATKCDVVRTETNQWTDCYVTTKKGQIIPMLYFVQSDARGKNLRHKYKMKALMNRHYKQKEITNETNND